MRTYGRTYDNLGNATWVVVQTDTSGYNDYVMITTLIQCLKLNLGESPFYANFGIPAKNSVQQQIQPDFYVSFLQSYFSKFFASLIISKVPISPPNFTSRAPPQFSSIKNGPIEAYFPTPTYNISIIRMNGSKFQAVIAT